MILAVDVPNPIDVVTGALGDATGWAWDKVAEGITIWVLGAVGHFVDGVVDFLLTSADADVESAWFAGAGSPYATVRNVAGVALVAFALLGVIQGLLTNDLGGMVRRVSVDLPLAVLGMIATIAVTGRLLDITDALAAAVLGNADGQAVHFLSGFGVSVNNATQGFAAVLLGLVVVLAAFFVWVELMVRSVLVYVLVAMSPLAFAAMVWPAARGVLRRTVELLVAVILSKLVISIALAVGVAALSGAGSAGTAGAPEAGIVDQGSVSLGTLLVGAAVLGMAAFAPFMVLKLIPVAEAAVVAYGVSRSPMRAAQATMSNVYYLSSVRRLAGGPTSSAGPGTGDAPPRAQGTTGGTGATTKLGGAGAAAAAAGVAGAVSTTASTLSNAVDTATAPPPGGASQRVTRPHDGSRSRSESTDGEP